MEKSIELKEQGNRRFQNGDFVGADSLYSKAYVSPILIISSIPY